MPKGRGLRLTDEQKNEIKNSGNVTLAELAKKYGTSINTIQRYRSPGKRAMQPKQAAERATNSNGNADTLRRDLREITKMSLSDRAFRAVVGNLIA